MVAVADKRRDHHRNNMIFPSTMPSAYAGPGKTLVLGMVRSS
jgi:hypothetical protein